MMADKQTSLFITINDDNSAEAEILFKKVHFPSYFALFRGTPSIINLGFLKAQFREYHSYFEFPEEFKVNILYSVSKGNNK